jgi:hypothetical protein
MLRHSHTSRIYIWVSCGGRQNHYTRFIRSRSCPDWVFVSIKSFCSRISNKLIFIESLSRDYLGEVNVFPDKSLFERIHKILVFALKNEKQKCLEIWSQWNWSQKISEKKVLRFFRKLAQKKASKTLMRKLAYVKVIFWNFSGQIRANVIF